MRFGMSGCFLPADMKEITPEMCRRVRSLGFSGIFTRFRANHPLETNLEHAREVRRIMEGEGVRLYQATGFWQNLVTPDESERLQNVKVLQGALRLAGALGARGIDTGPGSMHPEGPWFPHPENWTASARAQLVKSLKESAPVAEEEGVYLSLEGHQLVTLSSAEVTRDILDEVGSRWVRSDFDSANWITLDTVFNTGPALDQMFDVLGEHIVSCHAKDIWIENKLTLHLQDGCCGKGLMDFATLFRRMEALNPEYPVIAEGNSTEELPEVSALFHRLADELGIRVLDADAA
jgi:sugar phosphate isomerase/epimerase